MAAGSRAEAQNLQQQFANPMGLSERDKENPGPGQTTYLIVGYTTRKEVEGVLKKSKDAAMKEQKIVGIEAPETAIPWSEQEPPTTICKPYGTE